jgi:alcohol dehydrogenase
MTCNNCTLIRAAVGKDFLVGVKLNSADFQKGGFDESESVQVVQKLSEMGIDFIKAEITQSLRNELWEKLGNGEIGKPIIHQVFDFKNVAKAHIKMDKGTHIGKVMLDFTLLN